MGFCFSSMRRAKSNPCRVRNFRVPAYAPSFSLNRLTLKIDDRCWALQCGKARDLPRQPVDIGFTGPAVASGNEREQSHKKPAAVSPPSAFDNLRQVARMASSRQRSVTTRRPLRVTATECRRGTPRDALARDRVQRQVSWLAGRCAVPRSRLPSGSDLAIIKQARMAVTTIRRPRAEKETPHPRW
jgi:hypothetical protein